MVIAVNARLLIKNKLEGIGRFGYETLKRITAKHPEVEFIFLFDRPYSQEFIFNSNVHPVVIQTPTRHPVLWYWWFEKLLPPYLKEKKPDLFFSFDGFLSLNSNINSLPVIHDLNFEHYPLDMPWLVSKYYRSFFPRYAKLASRIATVSYFSQQDISTLYRIPKDRIDVVYNGISGDFKPATETVKKETRKKISEGEPYFLFVGAIHQRKNITNLMRSFDLFKQREGTPHKLVIAGNRKWWTHEMSYIYSNMKHGADVIFTGRIPDKELFDLTAAAFAVTYISTFEGFGMPILEAMQSEVPVITSNVTAMPEVAADAALLVDPFSIEAIAGSMTKLFKDDALRKTLIEKGKRRAADFSWDTTADKLWQCMAKLL